MEGPLARWYAAQLSGEDPAALQLLLAPPADSEWSTLWSSEHPRYGGIGTPPLDTDDNWRIPGYAAVLLKPWPNHAGA